MELKRSFKADHLSVKEATFILFKAKTVTYELCAAVNELLQGNEMRVYIKLSLSVSGKLLHTKLLILTGKFIIELILSL